MLLSALPALAAAPGPTPGAASPAPAPPSSVSSPASPAAPSKDQLTRYGRALAAGREADRRGQLAAARTAFEQAVAAYPEGAAALSELGWAAYRLHDLPAAEKVTRKAITRSATPKLRAASLYNLGKILTEKGDKPGAVQAYRESWQARENPVVLAALKALDPQAAALTWPTLSALEGPLKPGSTEAAAIQKEFCRTYFWAEVKKYQVDNFDEEWQKGSGKEQPECQSKAIALAQTPGRFRQALLLQAEASANHFTQRTFSIVVQTESGWYGAPLRSSFDGRSDGESAELGEAGQQGAALLVRIDETHRDELDSLRFWKGVDKDISEPPTQYELTGYAYVIGIGPSGRPSLSSAIATRRQRTLSWIAKDRKETAEKVYDVKLQPDGSLVIAAPRISRNGITKQEFPDDVLLTAVGSFPLAFP